MSDQPKRNLRVEFLQHSQDFLVLLGTKSRAAEKSKQVAEELATLEFFWDGVEAIFNKYEEKIAELKLIGLNEHAKVVLLRNELRETYNEMYKVRAKIPDVVQKLIAKTKLPSKEELQEDVQLKNRPANG